jgi:SecD/SecF fusion protein
MRSLVAIFAGFLILYSIYQLSFTWFVFSHEKAQLDKAKSWVSKSYPAPGVKYAGDQEKQALYKDSLADFEKLRHKKLLDSTRDTKVTWWGHTYQEALEKEMRLGLDLQGGINVTMDIELTGLIKAVSNNPNDPALKKAIEDAVATKTNSDADFITLFQQSFEKVNPGQKLAPLFSNNSRNKLKADASNNTTIAYIREQAVAAMNQTYQVLQKRIDKFGVSQPTIDLDENRGIITVELAGANEPERVRKYLQSTANLQFWEVYNIGEIAQSVQNADKTLEDYLNGTASADTTKAVTDTTKGKVNDIGALTGGAGKTDTSKNASVNKNKLLIAFAPAFQAAQQNKDYMPSYVGAAGIADTSSINEYLANPVVAANFPANCKFLWGKRERDDKGKLSDFLYLYAIKTIPGQDKARIEGDAITDANQDFDPTTSQVNVTMAMNKAGEREWEKMTGENINRPIAIVLDDIVYSAPNVEGKISGGNSRITMGGKKNDQTVKEAQDLSSILKSGKLNAPAKIVQFQEVGPTLGFEAIAGGAKSFLISFIVIFLLMLVYYNTAGWVANIALILNLLFTVGVLSSMGATLTAPGIAGLVLTIGMAVDTNVIIFERIKEELTRGKSYQQAVADGYKRSLAPVLDAHVTTLLTAIILFYFGLGPVLGFATTQILGILLSLFCGIMVSRLITDFYTNKQRHFNYFTNLSRRIFKHANFKFIEYRKVAYAISVVVLILGIGAVFNGFKYGVEFSGGRSYVIKFDRPVANETNNIAQSLNKVLDRNPIVKVYGTSNQLEITTDYMIDKQGEEIDLQVQNKLYEGLKPYLAANTTATEFATKYKQGSKRVDPTISDDLKSGAKWATFWSLLIITVYIFIRFRDWRYSLGTIVALLHDVLVTLAVFSFFKNIVPFPLEIDQHFIAAVLTVIGFSMNDTVIVFDRVREYSHQMKGVSKDVVINRAINDTLSRTIMTSLTVFLTILILFLVGSEVTKGFAFAMLIGVITGTYSSIFVAAPILVDFAKNKPLGQADLLPHEEAKKAAPAKEKA